MENDAKREMIEAGIASYRKKMEGSVLTPKVANRTATPDAIKLFANGLGDANPLWKSVDYAVESIHGGIIAPPGFLNAVVEGQAIVGLPGLIATFVGAQWEWHKVIRAGDSFAVTNTLEPLVDKTKPGGPRRLLQSGKLNYQNQRGEVAGSCRWTLFRTEAGLGTEKVGEGGSSKPDMDKASEQPLVAANEFELLCEQIRAEPIRGRKPRYFEDVEVGEVLPPVIKGPLSLSDMMAWAMGIRWQRTSLAHGPKLLFLQDNPGLSYLDSKMGFPEPIAMSHFEPGAALTLMGSHLPMDIGFQRVCWLTHPITNWMGDAGFLQKLNVRLSGFVRFGDICRPGARVTGKRVDCERPLIDLEIYCNNQKGQKVAHGEASLVLPTRAGNQMGLKAL